MITMLGAALIGDLLLLPAILAGPLGRFFGGKPAERTDAAFYWTSFSPADLTSDLRPAEQATPAPKPEPVAPDDAPAPSEPGSRSELLHGPHAELHAKLRQLRREQT